MSDVQEQDVAAVAAKAKKMSVVETYGENGAVLYTITFAHGPVHRFALIPESDMFARFAAHGARQKLGDAGSTKKTPEEAEKAVAALIEAMESGEWSVKGSGGDGEPTGGLLAKALANLYEKELAEVQTYLAGLHEDPKERTKIHNALRAQDAVAKEIERIRPPKRERKVNESAAQAAAQALAGLQG